MENKTHYRKVFKSDHLGSADLEEFIEDKKSLIFTIKHVKQYIYENNDKKTGIVVAGKRISANIAYFVEDIKPLVLNATNSKIVKSFCRSSFTQDWNNVLIELYVDTNVRLVKETVSGVRIMPRQPIKTKPSFDKTLFQDAKKKNATIEMIKNAYLLTPEMEQAYIEYGAKK
jgi:hypothetical protein